MSDVKNLSRRERASRTRRAIVRAATEEFRSSGYHGASMAAIARRAGVAVQTVYFVFHTKPLLLTATIDNAVLGEDHPTPPDQTDWWREGTSTPDGRRALELFVTNAAAIEERAAAVTRAARAAAATDPEVRDVLARHEELRAAAFRSYVDALTSRGLLRAGLDPSDATDILLTVAGSSVFLDFTEARGWSVEKYVCWAADTLYRLLLAA